jgi:hypothetical protein
MEEEWSWLYMDKFQRPAPECVRLALLSRSYEIPVACAWRRSDASTSRKIPASYQFQALEVLLALPLKSSSHPSLAASLSPTPPLESSLCPSFAAPLSFTFLFESLNPSFAALLRSAAFVDSYLQRIICCKTDIPDLS